MGNKKVIAIVGITGSQGGSVANTFLNEPGWTVRGVTRDPTKAASQTLTKRGAEMVQGDFDDPQSMFRALRGANVIYGNTDFIQNMMNPEFQARAQQQGRAPNELATDHELVQAKCLMDAVASTLDTLDLFIFSAFAGTKDITQGKISYNLHFDCKWEAIKYLKAQHPKAWERTSLLALGLYMTNIWFEWYLPRKQSDGSFKMRLPIGGDTPVPMIEPSTDTGPLVKTLVQLPPGQNVTGTGEVISWNQWCQTWGQINGVKCTFERMPAGELETIIGPFGKEMTAAFQFIEEYGLDGGVPGAKYPWDLPVETPLTSIETYLRGQDWSKVVSA